MCGGVRYLFYFASVLTAAGILRGFPQTTATTPGSGMGFVTGSVYCSDTNLPARIAEVVFDPAPSQDSHGLHSEAVLTDLSGRFRSAGIAPGDYIVSADVDGYLQIGAGRLEDPWVRNSPEARREIESRFTRVTVAANQTVNVALQIERGTEIRGTVQYDDGSPAIGLPITFGRKPSHPQNTDQPADLYGSPIQDYFTRTDDHGGFRIRGVFPGLYQISVVVPTYSVLDATDDMTRTLDTSSGALRVYDDGAFEASRSRGIDVKDGDSEKDVNITVPLTSLHTVQGEVALKGLGSPPLAAAIQLHYADTREIARTGVARDGSFQLNYVPDGTYILRVAASSLPAFPKIHLCPPDCQRSSPSAFGAFVEAPLIVAGDVSDLVITVSPAPGATP